MHRVANHKTALGMVRKPTLSSVGTRRTRDAKLLAIIIILAVVLRILSALFQGNNVEALPGIHDQISYDALAQRVIDGHGFSFAANHWPATRANEPTAHWSFLYTLYLAASYVVFGLHPIVARLIQASIVGVLHTWLAWRVGTRIFGPTIGLLSALLSATYLYFVYYAGALITEPFYIAAILWTFDVALRISSAQGAVFSGNEKGKAIWMLWLELGLAVGIAILLRQLFLLFVPCLLLWLWWSFERSGSRELGQSPIGLRRLSLRLWTKQGTQFVTGVALTLAVIALLIVPWTLRNYRVFHQFVPLNTNSGYAFFWGNHPYYGSHFVGILPEDGPTYLDLIPPELLVLNEAEMDQALLKRGIGFVIDDPLRYLLLSLSRWQEYFKFWPEADSSLLSNLVRVSSFGLALPFILYGLWISARNFWQEANQNQQSALVLLYLFVAVYTTIHLLVWTLIRYRLPVDAVFLFFAAVGLHKVSRWALSHVGSIQLSQSRNESQFQ